MSANLPDFDKADYVTPARTHSQPSAYASQTILSGEVLSGGDAHGWDAQQNDLQTQDHARFLKAIVYGIGAAIAGSLLYAGFTIITHIMIGYIAVGVGYLVGKAMLTATGGHSSRKYQVAAAILTYLSVSFAAVPEILWALHKNGTDISHLSRRGLIFLAEYGVASPFLGLKRQGLSALIGLLILFIGMRAAWKLTENRDAPTMI